MGGRGASSGMSNKRKPYGTEFQSLLKVSNIRFVKNNDAGNAKDPLETMTKGRVYVTVNADGELNTINYYGLDGKRVKAINMTHNHGDIKGSHVHEGYYHDENGTRHLTPQEKELVAFVRRAWHNKSGK